MITQYIAAAMKQAQFELMENGRYFATIPACRGCWAEGANIEECRTELPEVLDAEMSPIFDPGQFPSVARAHLRRVFWIRISRRAKTVDHPLALAEPLHAAVE